jgi:hypothetical protein
MEVHRNHKDNLKYVCRICSAQYGRSFALTDHIKSEHPDMRETEGEDEVYVIEELQPTETEVFSVIIESDTVDSNGER